MVLSTADREKVEILQTVGILKSIHTKFVQQPELQEGVQGQELVHHQGLLINYNVMTTLYRNLYIHLRHHNSPEAAEIIAGETLTALVDEAVDQSHSYVRSARKFFSQVSMVHQPQLCRQFKWPVPIPVLSCTYDSRKHEVITHMTNQMAQCSIDDQHKVILPPIYIPVSTDGGESYIFLQYFQKKVQVNYQWQKTKEVEIPVHIRNSKHFKRVQKLLRENPHLYNTQVKPNCVSNWIYYLIMHDPMAHPDYRDQGYIGETKTRLSSRWKQHQDDALLAIRKITDFPSRISLVDCNLALLNINLKLRGDSDNISDYAAIIALGSIPSPEKVPGTDVSLREAIEGQLVLEEFISSDGVRVCVADMKWGMNDKQRVSKVNPRKMEQLHSSKEEFSRMIRKCWSDIAGKSLSFESKMNILIENWPKLPSSVSN